MDPPLKRPKRNTTALSSTRILNSDSPITKQETDIRTFLSICLLNWNQYTEDEKRNIVFTLPSAYQILRYDAENRIVCPVSPEFVANDSVVRDQIARFKRDVSDGFYTKTWQDRARKATEERANGRFDDYLANHNKDLYVSTADEEVAEAASSDGDYSTMQGRKSKRKGGRVENKLSRASSMLEDMEDAGADNKVDELAK